MKRQHFEAQRKLFEQAPNVQRKRMKLNNLSFYSKLIFKNIFSHKNLEKKFEKITFKTYLR